MNIFSYFEAHKNPIAGVLQRIGKREENKQRGFPERLIAILGKIVTTVVPFLYSVEKALSKLYMLFKGSQDLQRLGNRKKELSVIIVNWNGESFLPACLSNLYRALDNVPGDHEVIVADNGSSDRSVEFVRENFPQVKIVELKKNMGFAKGNNRGLKSATKDLVMLLNNDMVLPEDVFGPLLDHFEDETVAAVQPKIILKDGSINEGHSWGEFKDGMPLFLNERQFENIKMLDKPAVTLYPIGGCAIVDRKLYWKLGGLDEIFSPFSWEDDDMGYRILKRGYKVIYEPGVSVVHEHSATINPDRFPTYYLKAIKEKNMLLCLWKNLTYGPYLTEYLKTITSRINIAAEKGNYSFIVAHIIGFLQFGEVMRRRIKEAPWVRVNDKEVFSITRGERSEPLPRNYKPHVLLVTPFLPFPPNNGGAIRIYNLTKQLTDHYEFTLVSFVESRSQEKYMAEYMDMFRDVHLIERKPTPVEDLMSSELPLAYTHYINLEMIRTIEGLLDKGGVDIVQIEFPWIAFYGSLVRNHPSVFVEHDIGNMFYGKGFVRPEKGLEGLLAPLKAINYASNFIESFDSVVTVTDKDRDYLNALFPGTNPHVIEQGVDTSEFPYQYSANGDKNLVYLGHYRHYPNEDAIVYFVEEILPLIKEQHEDVKLYIVGSHPTRKINRLKVRDDIVVTGMVPDVSKYLRKGTIFIAPLRKGMGLKGKLLEAMATGLPVVATPVAAAGINAKEGEEIFIASTPEDFARKVSTLLGDKPLRERLSRKGRMLMEEKFDWKVHAGKMDAVYRALV